jgi:uncharacterized membrane protein YphA (DoxX/SURF4 family)
VAPLLKDRLIGRLGLALVFAGFGYWELTQPSQWAGYVPPFVAAHVPAIPLVLAHGWLLLMLGVALLIDFWPEVAVWVAVGVMIEIVLGLLVTSGFSSTLLRDLGLLGLALATALGGRDAGRRVGVGAAAVPSRR